MGLSRGRWPHPFRDGRLTRCWLKEVSPWFRSPTLKTLYEGNERLVVELLIEAASGLRLGRGWRAMPHHCGDRSCFNPHHWVVSRFPQCEAPPVPMRPGFRQMIAYEPDCVHELVGTMSDWREVSPLTLQRRRPEFPVLWFRQAQLFLSAREFGGA